VSSTEKIADCGNVVIDTAFLFLIHRQRGQGKRRKREEGRGKREEGRGKREEGTGMRNSAGVKWVGC